MVIEAGARWRIGDGSTIDILNTPWLPHDTEPFVLTASAALDGMKVSDLLQPESREWNVDLIFELFDERDRDLILGIPLGVEGGQDRLYWSKEASGSYSVRSAYHLLQFLKGRWGSELHSGFWKRLWRLKIPPKAKDLVWRACTQCLPTLVQLRTKHVSVYAACPTCRNGDETIFHSLVQCNFSRQCHNSIMAGAGEQQAECFADWFDRLGRRLGKEELGELAVMCWAIWRARNEVVWNGKTSAAVNVVSTMRGYLDQWRNAQRVDFIAPLPMGLENDGAVTWVKPHGTQIKVNVDAALFSESGRYGFGLIARDSQGQLVEARTCQRIGTTRPELAEVMGIREALSWVKGKEWRDAVLETDCLVAVSAIRSRVPMISPFGIVVSECRKLLDEMSGVSFLFVYRSANKVAHSLARASCSFPERVIGRGCVPSDLSSRLIDDL